MARLIIESGGESREYAVHETVTLGRGRKATVQLEDKLLSREHTRVSVDRHPDGSMTYSVRDMGSKNGTFLNGDLIRRIEPLKNGDKIRLGSIVLRFSAEDRAKPRPKAPAKAHKPPTRRAHAKGRSAMSGLKAAVMRKREREGEPAGGGGFFTFLMVLVVLAAGTYGSKLVFVWAFERAFSG